MLKDTTRLVNKNKQQNKESSNQTITSISKQDQKPRSQKPNCRIQNTKANKQVNKVK